MNIEIRPATIKEIKEWWIEERAKNPTDYSHDVWEKWAIEGDESGRLQAFYAWDGEKIIGRATLIFQDDGDQAEWVGDGKAEIYDLDVNIEYRGKGISSSLVDAATTFAKQRDIHTLTIGVEPHETRNLQIYSRWGFTDFLGHGKETYPPRVKDGVGETINFLVYAKKI